MSAARPGVDVINVAISGDPPRDCTAIYRCPGCTRVHALGINNVDPGRPGWTWNGDTVLPVFSPSVLYGTTRKGQPVVCHSFVGINGAPPGSAIFLGDCTEGQAGKVLPLLPWIDAGTGLEAWDEVDA